MGNQAGVLSDNASRAELLAEYYFVQAKIGQYDTVLIAVKSLSIGASGALATAYFAMLNDAANQARPMLIVVAILAGIFWYVEAQWKSYQKISIDYGRKLEEVLRSPPPYVISKSNSAVGIEAGILRSETHSGPSIGRVYKEGWYIGIDRMKRFMGAFIQPNVWLSHAAIIGSSLIWYFFSPM